MKYIGSRLSRQLFAIIIIIFGIVFISLGIVLPNAMLPFYERNLYNYLSQPLYLIQENMQGNNTLDTEIAYVYRYENTQVISDNFTSIIPIRDIDELTSRMTNGYGKFLFFGKWYYYYKMESGGVTKFAITNSSYISKMRKELLYTILPILFITFVIVAFCLVGWRSSSGRYKSR